MSDKERFWLIAIWAFFFPFWIGSAFNDSNIHKQLKENSTEITELKQQLKDSKVHADVKFERCMGQLRGRHED